MTKFDPRTTLLVVALENELPRQLAVGWQIVYSGVGKVNAAITLCDALSSFRPKRVVNYGSAGALRKGLSGLRSRNTVFATGYGCACAWFFTWANTIRG